MTRDPIYKTTIHNHQVCTFSIACNLHRPKKDTEEVLFIDVHAWDEVAQSFAPYAQKGTRVLVEGYLRHLRWKDKENKPHQKHIIAAEKVTIQ